MREILDNFMEDPIPDSPAPVASDSELDIVPGTFNTLEAMPLSDVVTSDVLPWGASSLVSTSTGNNLGTPYVNFELKLYNNSGIVVDTVTEGWSIKTDVNSSNYVNGYIDTVYLNQILPILNTFDGNFDVKFSPPGVASTWHTYYRLGWDSPQSSFTFGDNLSGSVLTQWEIYKFYDLFSLGDPPYKRAFSPQSLVVTFYPTAQLRNPVGSVVVNINEDGSFTYPSGPVELSGDYLYARWDFAFDWPTQYAYYGPLPEPLVPGEYQLFTMRNVTDLGFGTTPPEPPGPIDNIENDVGGIFDILTSFWDWFSDLPGNLLDVIVHLFIPTSEDLENLMATIQSKFGDSNFITQAIATATSAHTAIVNLFVTSAAADSDVQAPSLTFDGFSYVIAGETLQILPPHDFGPEIDAIGPLLPIIHSVLTIIFGVAGFVGLIRMCSSCIYVWSEVVSGGSDMTFGTFCQCYFLFLLWPFRNAFSSDTEDDLISPSSVNIGGS